MAPKTPKKGPKALPSTLKRKTNVTPIVNGKLGSVKYTNWVVSAETAADDWDVHWICKFQGIDNVRQAQQAAYINPMKTEWRQKNDEAFSEPSYIKAFFPRRDPTRMEGQFTIPAQEGTSYTWDTLVTERNSDSDTAEFMGRNIAKLFTKRT